MTREHYQYIVSYWNLDPNYNTFSWMDAHISANMLAVHNTSVVAGPMIPVFVRIASDEVARDIIEFAKATEILFI